MMSTSDNWILCLLHSIPLTLIRNSNVSGEYSYTVLISSEVLTCQPLFGKIRTSLLHPLNLSFLSYFLLMKLSEVENNLCIGLWVIVLVAFTLIKKGKLLGKFLFLLLMFWDFLKQGLLEVLWVYCTL